MTVEAPMTSGKDSIQEMFQLAFARQQAGQPKQAEALYQSVLNRDPDHALANHNLGVITLQRGHHGAAVAYFRRAARLRPGLVETHVSLADAFKRAGCLDDAEASLRQAAGLGGGSAVGHFHLANLLYERGRLTEAEASYREAIRIKPDLCDAYNNLGNVLRQQDRREDALAMLHRALDIDPGYARAHNNIGNILRDFDRLEDSVASYREAVRHAPGFAVAHFNLGNALRDLGRMPEAAASFRKAIELDPSHADAYRHLVQVDRLDPDDLLVAVMQDKLQDPQVSEADRMHLAFALGVVFDQHGDYDRAFNHFQTGNSLKRKTFAYHPRETAELFGRIRQNFGSKAIRNAVPADNSDETPVFIVGMMRSGTTLMEQVLASHPDVAGGGELPFLQNLVDARAAATNTRYPEFVGGMQGPDFLEMGRQYIGMVRKRFGQEPRFITDKMPQNFLYAGLIHLMLPKARIICMQRDPLDTCLSVYTILFSEHHAYAYDLREAGLYTRFSRDLMAFWKDWLGDSIHFQSYEELVAEPEPAVRKLLAFCDLPFHENCLRFHATDRPVKTASASQVRERLNTRSVGRWRNYRNHLGALQSVFEGEPA
jgi:tetratricopeptide (TPR) repeat protein